MTRTVCAVCLVIAAVGMGCAPKAAEPPAVESEQGEDPSVVASESFETGSTETMQGADKAATEQPAEAP